MKWFVFLCALLFLASCTPFVATRATRDDENIVRTILRMENYFLVTDTTYYYGVEYYTTRYVYGIAENRFGTRGYFVLDKQNQFRPTIEWREHGEFVGGPDLW